MQNVYRPPHVKPFAEPARSDRPSVENQSVCIVRIHERAHRILRHRRGDWDFGQQPTVRSVKPQRPIRIPFDRVTFFVDRAVVPATEQREIRKRRRATVCPVPKVMSLAERKSAARKAAAAVSMVERPPQRRRNRPRPRADFDDPAVRVVPHHHATRVTREALGRFRGNARAVFEHGLAGLIGVGQHRGVDVNDDLIALAGSSGIESLVQRRFGEEDERVRLLLRHRRPVMAGGAL